MVALTAGVALVYGVLVLAGPKFSADSLRYLAGAGALLEGRFPSTESVQVFTIAPVWMYIGWVALIAVTKLLFGSAWAWAIVTINWLAVVATAYLILSLVHDLTRSRLALCAAAALMILAVDWLLFVRFVLSDMVFVALSTILLVSAIRQSVAPAGRLTLHLWAVAGVLLTRPASPPVLTFWFLALASIHRPQVLTVKRTAVGCAAVLAAALMAHSWAIAHPETVPEVLHVRRFDAVQPQYKFGVVIAERPSTRVAPARTVPAVAALTVRKWRAFFWPWLREYSAFHTTVNTAFFIPVYVLFLVAVCHSPERRAVLWLVLFIVFVSVFHAMQEIDPDHRYRMPVIPPLVVGAALGLASLTAGRQMVRIDAREHEQGLR